MFFYIFIFSLGLLPSFAWLFFYLKEDDHPEPPRWLVLAFLAGIGSAPLSLFVERSVLGAAQYFSKASSAAITDNILFMFLGVALVEELAKFAAVRFVLFKNPVLDEPEDAMIYMVTAALGFAGIENILVLNSYSQTHSLGIAVQAVMLRFVGANFLHALASGVIGYYWALSLTHSRAFHRFRLVVLGIMLAALLHGFFNLLIITLGPVYLFYTTLLLFIVGLVILKEFELTKKLHIRQPAETEPQIITP